MIKGPGFVNDEEILRNLGMGKKDSNAFLREDERKCLEEVLNASQSQLAEAMDLAHIVYWEFDTTTDTYVFNDSFYAFYGTSAEREGGYRMPTDEYAERFVHPDDRPLYHEHGRQILSGKGPAFLTDLEHRIVRRDGAVRFILVRGRGFRDATGRIVRLYGANQDISERKEAAAALLESEERCRKIFEESSLGMVMAGPDYHFMRANAAFCRMLGYAEPELISFTFEDITHPDHIAEDAMHVDALYRDKISFYRTEKRYVRKDKQIVWASTTVNTVRDKSGEFLYFLAMVEDISERKRAEEEREALESQLRHAQKMEAIGQLAGGIAHDFNNILTAIYGYSELIIMGMDQDSALRGFAEQIYTSAERAAELTHGLLAFSRKQVLQIKPLSLCSLVQELEKMLGRIVPEDIDFRTTVFDKDLIVMADKGQIGQVLMNLVTNAKDAMPKGGALTIDVSPTIIDEKLVLSHGFGEPGKYACISITDTGHGMDEETCKKIFEPFFTTKEVGKGTGLGMSIVYGIVKQHNGYITVYSEPGMGTTFKIYLSLITGEMEGIHGARRTEQTTGGTETILLAEDDATIRDLLGKRLENAGYTVIAAVDGRDALDRFIEHQMAVNILVTDVVMPNIDGKRLFEEIRKVRPDMKVLFLSGYTKDLVIEKGIQEDEFNYMAKPVMPSDLLKRVREILDGV